MPQPMYRSRPVPQVFEPDVRPGADTRVYCKGCGRPLEGHTRKPEGKTRVTVMMCEACQEIHGHELIPKSGAPSYCYRCGGPDELFVDEDFSPTTYRICPRCVPDRAERYRKGNFQPVLPDPPAS